MQTTLPFSFDQIDLFWSRANEIFVFFTTIFCATVILTDWSQCAGHTPYCTLGVCPLCTFSFYVTAQEHTSLCGFMSGNTFSFSSEFKPVHTVQSGYQCLHLLVPCEMFDAAVCNAERFQLVFECSLCFALFCSGMLCFVLFCNLQGSGQGGQGSVGTW